MSSIVDSVSEGLPTVQQNIMDHVLFEVVNG